MKRSQIWVGLVGVLASVGVFAAATDPGKSEYDVNCAVCHGMNGDGNGPYKPALVKAPTNLTLLAKQNGGTFPFNHVYQVIDGRIRVEGHGPSEMPSMGRPVHHARGGVLRRRAVRTREVRTRAASRADRVRVSVAGEVARSAGHAKTGEGTSRSLCGEKPQRCLRIISPTAGQRTTTPSAAWLSSSSRRHVGMNRTAGLLKPSKDCIGSKTALSDCFRRRGCMSAVGRKRTFVPKGPQQRWTRCRQSAATLAVRGARSANGPQHWNHVQGRGTRL